MDNFAQPCAEACGIDGDSSRVDWRRSWERAGSVRGNAAGRAAPAQAPTPAEAQGFEGTWQGTLHLGRQLRIATKITKADGLGYKAVYYSLDEGGLPLSIDKVWVDGSSLTLTLNLIGVKYEGKLSGDGKTIAGTWTQGPNTLPLPLTRATPETEWSIPTPPTPVPPMAADVNPNFEVATIKPSNPGAQGKAFFSGRGIS